MTSEKAVEAVARRLTQLNGWFEGATIGDKFNTPRWTMYSNAAQAAIDTLATLGWLPPEAVAAIERAALERAAAVCVEISWAEGIEWWLNATKKEVSAKSCHECKHAILALAPSASTFREVPEGYVMMKVAELEEIAKQHLSSDLTFEAEESADFEGAYDIIVSKVRAMLAARPQP